MNCEACGHDWFDHNNPDYNWGLCAGCFKEPQGGPCFPLEFR